MEKLKLCTILFLIPFLGVLNAQPQSEYTPAYQLEGMAWNDWDSISDDWMNTVYFQCLKENKLKLSCAHCSAIFIDAGFTIDEKGLLVDIQIFKEKVCGSKASEKLKNCFFAYFRNLVFPESLRKKKLFIKLGTGLKC